MLQVKVSAQGRSLVQRIPIDFGVSERDREASMIRRRWPTAGLFCHKKLINFG